MNDPIQLTNAVATCVVALTTIIYTIGTFLLWQVTRRSVELVNSQILLTEKITKSALLDEAFRSHREIFMRVIPKEATLSTLWEPRDSLLAAEPSPLDNPQRVGEEVFGSLIINHVARLFHHHSNGLMDEALWMGAAEDLGDLMRSSVMRRRWQAVRKYQTEAFRDFVDELLVNSKP